MGLTASLQCTNGTILGCRSSFGALCDLDNKLSIDAGTSNLLPARVYPAQRRIF